MQASKVSPEDLQGKWEGSLPTVQPQLLGTLAAVVEASTQTRSAHRRSDWRKED